MLYLIYLATVAKSSRRTSSDTANLDLSPAVSVEQFYLLNVELVTLSAWITWITTRSSLQHRSAAECVTKTPTKDVVNAESDSMTTAPSSGMDFSSLFDLLSALCINFSHLCYLTAVLCLYVNLNLQ